jgi:lysophospholipase L1-like esterase
MTNDWMKSDGIHFHSSGYQRIAGLLYDALHQAFQHHLSCENPTEK